MRLGVIKPLETRKFIVVSRQYLGSSEAEVINLWKEVMVSALGRVASCFRLCTAVCCAHGCVYEQAAGAEIFFMIMRNGSWTAFPLIVYYGPWTAFPMIVCIGP